MFDFTISLPHQTVFRVSTNCSIIADYFVLKYGKYVCSQAKNFTRPVKHITVLKKSLTYLIDFDCQKYITETPLNVLGEIISYNVEYDDDVIALHGAALEYKNKALLFLAPTMSGKSTLCTYLLSKDFNYITDDCILLNRETLNICPCTTPLHLRKGGIQTLAKYDIELNKLPTIEEADETRYVFTPKNEINADIVVEKIFFINRTMNKNECKLLNINDKMISLLKSPITHYVLSPDYITNIAKIAQKDCYELDYSDLKYVFDIATKS